jgi:hypothetical protein
MESLCGVGVFWNLIQLKVGVLANLLGELSEETQLEEVEIFLFFILGIEEIFNFSLNFVSLISEFSTFLSLFVENSTFLAKASLHKFVRHVDR